ncbi:MAG: hypothetical protein AAE986_06150 [Thermoplasmataceae archaeon]|jgi:hypothetical protein
MSHARLEHLYRKDLSQGIAESDAELSTYLAGAHFGFDFKYDPAAYIKGSLFDAIWLINEIIVKLRMVKIVLQGIQ